MHPRLPAGSGVFRVKPSLQREEDLFDAARGLPSGPKRAAFLERACLGNETLRQRIEELLRLEEASERFFLEGQTALEGIVIPAQFKVGLDSAEPALGAHIGRYQLLEKIGEGGYGAVFLAHQEEPFRRRVALKIVRLDIESPTVIARFEAERQALALMDHPNIARVYDAGTTEQGHPYFVMELVQGARLTEFCDQNRLTLRQRLDLFILVCHAIQHAHQKGIVHGDIKPSNILITLHDAVPIPKVIDFGISKATEIGRADPFGSPSYAPLIGTPAYMSPEQAEIGGLGIDTRSDIYSLGVLLYELLCGSPPFDGKELLSSGVDEMRRQLKETVAPRPSERLRDEAQRLPEKFASVAAARGATGRDLWRAVRGDLDSIAMRALEKDRQRRYETANGMAMDLQRHLQDEPVLAAPPSRLYRLRKLVRRNQVLFAAGSAVALALVAGSAVSTWMFFQEKEARQRAVAAEQEQNALRQKAEARERIVQAALLVNQERFDEADRLMDGLNLHEPTVEGAAVMRVLGEWHGLQKRWPQAAKRFRELLQIDQLDGRDTATLDYLELGPVLIELDDRPGYQRFSEEAVTRFAGRSFQESDRIVKVALLRPTPAALLDALRPLADENEKFWRAADSAGDMFQAAWRAMSLALWEYRCGHDVAAMEWCRRCLSYPQANAPRTATAHLILAMADRRKGLVGAAERELSAGRQPVEEKFHNPLVRGGPVEGFWFDWAFAAVLLREASGG